MPSWLWAYLRTRFQFLEVITLLDESGTRPILNTKLLISADLQKDNLERGILEPHNTADTTIELDRTWRKREAADDTVEPVGTWRKRSHDTPIVA